MFGNVEGVPVVEEREAVEQLVPVNNRTLWVVCCCPPGYASREDLQKGYQTYTKPDYSHCSYGLLDAVDGGAPG